ncbi:MAG: Mur ligase family protein, partial [Flavobacterium sp.]
MRLVVLGGGESGVGTAILGRKKGYAVFVSDFGKIKDNYKKVLVDNGIEWEEEGHTEGLIINATVVMKSPGIPDKAPIVKKLIEKGIAVISEIEFAASFTKAVTIGVTGSNGKTTTTMLAYHLLKSAGLNIGLGGNIGKSFALQVANDTYDSYILELSSFQLDGIVDYKPHIAIITNISPDHLDRYEYNYQNYINAKFRITMNQTEDDYLIYDADDEAITEWLKNN